MEGRTEKHEQWRGNWNFKFAYDYYRILFSSSRLLDSDVKGFGLNMKGDNIMINNLLNLISPMGIWAVGFLFLTFVLGTESNQKVFDSALLWRACMTPSGTHFYFPFIFFQIKFESNNSLQFIFNTSTNFQFCVYIRFLRYIFLNIKRFSRYKIYNYGTFI